MENNSFQSLGNMSYGDGNKSPASGGPKPPGQAPKLNKKAAIAGGAILALAVAVVILIKVLGGGAAAGKQSDPEKIAEEFIRMSFELKWSESYFKERYPKEAAKEIMKYYNLMDEDELEEMKGELENSGFKIEKLEVVNTEKIKKSELSSYEDYIGEVVEDVDVSAGVWVEMELKISMEGYEAEKQTVRMLVLTCNGKTGVWGGDMGGKVEYFWEEF